MHKRIKNSIKTFLIIKDSIQTKDKIGIDELNSKEKKMELNLDHRDYKFIIILPFNYLSNDLP